MVTHQDSGKRSILGTMERTTVTENPCPQFGASDTVWQFPKRVTLPCPHEEILSGYEEDVSPIRDSFSAWLKTDPEITLTRYIVDAKCANPAFREEPAREPLHPSKGISL